LLFSLTNLIFSLSDLIFSLIDFILILTDLPFARFFIVFVADLSLIGFLWIGWSSFKRLDNFHAFFTPNSSSVSICYFSYCISSTTLRSFSARNCSSCSRSELSTIHTKLSELARRFIELSRLSTELSRLFGKLFKVITCSPKWYWHSTCSTNLIKLFELPTELTELASCSIELSTCSIELSYMSTLFAKLSKLSAHLDDLSMLLDWFMTLNLLADFSTCFCSSPELHPIINNTASSSTSSARLVVSSLSFSYHIALICLPDSFSTTPFQIDPAPPSLPTRFKHLFCKMLNSNLYIQFFFFSTWAASQLCLSFKYNTWFFIRIEFPFSTIWPMLKILLFSSGT